MWMMVFNSKWIFETTYSRVSSEMAEVNVHHMLKTRGRKEVDNAVVSLV